MKKTIINIMFTSNAVLIFIAIYAAIMKDELIYTRTIFEVLGANIIIFLGVYFTQKFESKYVFLEYLVDIGFILFVVSIFAFFFKWYYSMPIWIILIIGVVVYIFNILLNTVRNRNTAKRINELLQKRKKALNTVT